MAIEYGSSSSSASPSPSLLTRGLVTEHCRDAFFASLSSTFFARPLSKLAGHVCWHGHACSYHFPGRSVMLHHSCAYFPLHQCQFRASIPALDHKGVTTGSFHIT